MNAADRVIKSAFASVLALGIVTVANQSLAVQGDFEKCAGIIKAGGVTGELSPAAQTAMGKA